MAARVRAPKVKEGLRTGSSIRNLHGSRPCVNQSRNANPLLGVLMQEELLVPQEVDSVLTGLGEMTLSKVLDAF